MAATSAGHPTCLLAGCNRPRHIDAKTNFMHDYCGRTHAAQALAQRGEPLADPHGYCPTCQLPGCAEPVCCDGSTGPRGALTPSLVGAL